MIIGRFLLRFILVPLGAGCAILAAVLFVTAANWNRFASLVAAEQGSDQEFFVALVFVGGWVMFIAAISAAAMMMPAAPGALIAEAFAIRSWIFHVANGALSAFIGFNTMVDMQRPANFYSEPVIVVGAGIVAGFVYWLVAGWSAGFWKPVFAPPPQSLPPGQALPGAPPQA
ncbi:MAG: hypothetical protein K2Z80_34100 [Xanthobacteraceae bacterium]|nr:hypothetical protein [Xanthobacteraceae bacterium]